MATPDIEALLDRYDGSLAAVAARATWPALRTYHRARCTGLGNLPEGPAVLVANHGGAMAFGDAVFWAAYHEALGPTAPPLYVLAHRMFTRVRPGLTQLLARFGVVEAHPDVAQAILARRARLLVYPGGDHDSLRSYWRRAEVDFGGRRGFFRLARDAGVPLVPVTTAGSHETFVVLWQGKGLADKLGFRHLGLHSFPLVLCLPWGLLVGPTALLPYLPLPARIDVHVGAALPADDYDAVLAALQDQLAELYAHRRWPVLG